MVPGPWTGPQRDPDYALHHPWHTGEVVELQLRDSDREKQGTGIGLVEDLVDDGIYIIYIYLFRGLTSTQQQHLALSPAALAELRALINAAAREEELAHLRHMLRNADCRGSDATIGTGSLHDPSKQGVRVLSKHIRGRPFSLSTFLNLWRS
eukprot:3826795-Amphidinium_carterae.1